ncbi:hypothetical protein [Bosea sp. F3-2]|uniref:hypothetical protein n=1 Tax=Bosea sp. F3-2 TaxID=2599640 RepID=UPI0020BE79F1|nr:hypothetical protein [Bosea sp. F3-2]
MSFVLGHGRGDVDGELIRGREVAGYEIDPAFHKGGHEGDVTRQTVELGDHEGRFVQPARRERGC